jgi:hypothetical protein
METMNETTNRIAFADEWADEARAAGKTERADNAEMIELRRRALERTPTYLGICNGVHYDSKGSTYIAKFEGASLKVTDDVAEYLLTNKTHNTMLPTIYARMEKGVIVEVLLLFVSRAR